MNRTVYYALVTTLVCLGGVLAVLLFPFYQQVSLMLVYDRQYQKALPRYKQLYWEGKKTATVVNPLLKLSLEEGLDTEAIAIARAYVADHPDSLEAHQVLGQLLRDNHQYYPYVENLRDIYRLQPSLANLREQRDLFELLEYEDEEMIALEQILSWEGAKSPEFHQLAYLQASHGQQERALATLRQMVKNIPADHLRLLDAQFALSYFAEAHQLQDVKQLAEALVRTYQSKQIALSLAQTLLNADQAEEASHLLDLLPEVEQSAPEVIAMRISLLSREDGDQKRLLKYLLRLRRDGHLPSRAYPQLFSLAVGLNLTSLVTELVPELPLQQMDEVALLSAVRLAIIDHDDSLARALRLRLGVRYLNSHPLMAIGLDLTDPYESEKLDARGDGFNNRNRLLLAELYQAKQFSRLAKQLILQVDSWDGVEDFLLPDVTALYIQMGLEQEGLSLIHQINDHSIIHTEGFETAALMLETAFGHTKLVLDRLKTKEKVSRYQLSVLQDVAYERRQADLALALAERLAADYPSESSQARLGQALVLNGQLEQGLNILRSLYSQKPSAFSKIYLVALGLATRQEERYRQELDQILERTLTLEEVARTEWREIAFSFVDQGLKQEAIQIGRWLASELPFESPDVQFLLQLWGDQPDAPALAWMLSRATLAAGKEKFLWAKQLFDVKAYPMVIQILTRIDLQDDQFSDLYIETLIALKDRCRIEAFITETYPDETRPKRLQMLGKLAKDFDFLDLAEEAYGQALDLAPTDLKIVRELGLLAFAKGAVSRAYWYLEDYLADQKGDYLSYFATGEILLQEKCRELAKSYFLMALEAVGEIPHPDLAARKTEAQLYYRVGSLCMAMDRYWALIKEYPDDLSLRMDLANIYLDIDDHALAAPLLFHEPFTQKPDDDPHTLELLQVELLAMQQRYFREQHDYASGFILSEYALNRYSTHESVWAARASLEADIGRWRRSLGYWEIAQDLAPDNESYERGWYDLWSAHLPYLNVQTENRLTTPAQHERFHRFEWTDYLNSDMRLLLQVERDFMTLDAYTQFSTGDVVPFDGARHRGRFVALREFDCGMTAEGKLFAGDGVIGCGAQWTTLDVYGLWSLFGDYHEPCWDFTESTIEQGVRNRIGFRRHQIVLPRLDIDFQLSYHQYNLFATIPSARTWELQILLSHLINYKRNDFLREQLPEGSAFGLNCLFTEERGIWVLTKTSATGASYQPLGFSDTELCTFFLSFTLPFTPFVLVEGTGGCTWDVLGQSVGPIGSVSVALGEKGGPQARVLASHYFSSQFTASTVDSVQFEFNFPY